MVYISADDVLANFAIDSLNQLRQAATDDGDQVMALFDPNDGSEETFRYRFDGTNKTHQPLWREVERQKLKSSTQFLERNALSTWRIQRL